MTRSDVLTKDTLDRLLHLDRSTWRLYWKQRDKDFFPTEGSWKSWNSHYAGKEALCAPNSNGYLSGRVCRFTVEAHRVIWIMVYGTVPAMIDHIDGDRENNNPDNLREVSSYENTRNVARRCTNKSGQTGVHWRQNVNRWQARINVGSTRISLGHFTTFEQAVQARKEAEARYGYHPNHGR